MQNKNRILNRRGFAAIAAIFMMLLITLMLLKMLSYSTDVAARTSNDYLNEQAQLLAFNATEDAIYRISGHDTSVSCQPSYTMYYPATGPRMFDIQIDIRYVWSNGMTPGGANCLNYIDNTQAVTDQLVTDVSNGEAVIDVYVTNDANLKLDEPIRFHRKTLQKL